MPVSSALSSYRYFGSLSPISEQAQGHSLAEERTLGKLQKGNGRFGLRTDSRHLSALLLRHIQRGALLQRLQRPFWTTLCNFPAETLIRTTKRMTAAVSGSFWLRPVQNERHALDTDEDWRV